MLETSKFRCQRNTNLSIAIYPDGKKDQLFTIFTNFLLHSFLVLETFKFSRLTNTNLSIGIYSDGKEKRFIWNERAEVVYVNH